MQEIIFYNGEAEDLELRRLAYKVDARKNRAAREAAEARAQRAETKLRAERAKARKEKRELGAFLMVIALVVVMAVCVTAAPVWTAAFPFAGALLVMRKVGWLKNG
jgi:Flp pilus assembly protein TadB